MLRKMKGNIIDLAEAGHFDVIVHGCNCQNTMGSGLAREIKLRYPGAYQADTCQANIKNNVVGTYSTYCGEKFDIVNAYTQFHYLPRGVDHFEYEGFSNILTSLAYRYTPMFSIGFPYIGMGLAGGNPERIIAMLQGFAIDMFRRDSDVTLVEFEP